MVGHLGKRRQNPFYGTDGYPSRERLPRSFAGRNRAATFCEAKLVVEPRDTICIVWFHPCAEFFAESESVCATWHISFRPKQNLLSIPACDVCRWWNAAHKTFCFTFCTRMCRKALDNEFCEAKLVLKTAQDVQFSNKLDAEANGAI